MENGGVFLIPYGEWVLLMVSLVTWAEQMPLARFMLRLSVAWTGGKIVEGFMDYAPLHWNLARLAVLVVFFWGAWQRSSKSLLSLTVPSLILVAEDLLVANEPGIIPLEYWLFLGALFVTAWISSHSYWGMAAAVAGSLLVKEGFALLAFGGLLRHQDVPDPFYWHAGAVLLLLAGLVKPLLEIRGEELQKTLESFERNPERNSQAGLENSLSGMQYFSNSEREPEL